MSVTVRRFEMTTGGHSKFWEVSVVEKDGLAYLTRRWGKLGTVGQNSTEPRPSKYGAAREMSDLIDQKLAKGYKEVSPRVLAKGYKEVSPRVRPTPPTPSPTMITDHAFKPYVPSYGNPKFCTICGRNADEHSHADYSDIKGKSTSLTVDELDGAIAAVAAKSPPEPPKPMTLADIRNKYRVKDILA